MILGIICGLASYTQFGVANFAEFFYIIYGLLNIIKDKKIKFDLNFKKYMMMSVFFILYTCIYFGLDLVSKAYLVKNVFKYIAILALTILAYQQCLKNEKGFIRFLITFLITNIVAMFWMVDLHSFSAYIHYSLFTFPIFLLMSYFNSNKKIIKILYLIAFGLAIVGRSRTSLILLIVAILYYLYQSFLKKKNNKKLLIKKISIIFLIIILLSASVMFFVKNLSKKSASNTERTLLLKVAIQEIKENPFLGVGPGNYNVYAQEKLGVKLASQELTTHNYFLQIIAEWGIFGFIIFIIPYIPLIKNMLLNKEEYEMKYMRIYIFYFVTLFFNVLSGDARLIFSFALALMFFDYGKTNMKGNYNEKCNSNIEL